jgi:hypothetical protein
LGRAQAVSLLHIFYQVIFLLLLIHSEVKTQSSCFLLFPSARCRNKSKGLQWCCPSGHEGCC